MRSACPVFEALKFAAANWDGPTAIHVFYALKMGPQYRARYLQHFAHPVLHEHDLQHEELLACCPEQWAALVREICLSEPK